MAAELWALFMMASLFAKQPKVYKKPTVEIDVKAVVILSQFSEPSHSYNVYINHA